MNQKLRFSIFHRDGFGCGYCGKKPPETLLEIDHIVAKSKGGTDKKENLITSCFDCNRGKSNIDLKDIPKKIQINLQEVKEKRKQLKEFYNYQKDLEQANILDMLEITNYWEDLWDGRYSLSTRGEGSIKYFLKTFNREEIKEAMFQGVSRVNDINGAFRYMCGILHNKKRGS